ncbi:hypothetical protein V8G54_035651 [Vigna mungo]|uniref:Uncharacterized protein n=1 Tax=Vigna mungo TaxID=3915 RepID=A0AAQ3MFP3_VIGMU
MSYTLVFTLEGGDLEAIPVEVPRIRKDMKMTFSRYLFDKLLSLKTIKWHNILENLISIIDTNNSYRRSDQGTLYRSIPRSQQAYAGVSQSHSLLPVASVSDDPQIIPSFHRKMIMKKDQKADLWVHIYLSILKSIVTPSTGLPRQSQLKNEIVALSKDLILRGYVGSQLGKRDLSGGRKGEKTRGGIFYPTICVMKSFGLYINSHCDYDAGHFGESIDSGSPGRLSQSTEAGAGKRQIFAIGNFVNQRVLKPLHDFLMDTLRSSDRIDEKVSSATDRWPLSLKTNHLIRTLFGGQSVGDCLDAIFSRSMKYPFFAQFEKVYPGQRLTRYAILGDDVCIADENVASLYRQTVNDLGRKRSLPVLTWISGDGRRRPEATSSRGRSLALGDRLAVSLATAKRLPSAKDSFLSQQEDARLHFKELTRLTLPRLSQGLVSRVELEP